MTIEQILECSAEQLAAMTDEELLQHFEPYLNVTRPERAVRVTREPSKPYVSPALQAGMKKAAELGIDLSYLNNMPRRKK